MESTTEIAPSSIFFFFFLLLKVLFPFKMPFPICGFRTPSWNELPLGIGHISKHLRYHSLDISQGQNYSLNCDFGALLVKLLYFLQRKVAQKSPPRQDLCVLTRTTIRVLPCKSSFACAKDMGQLYICSREQDEFMRPSSLKIIYSTLSH